MKYFAPIILAIGLLWLYIFWPISTTLPILGTVTGWNLETVWPEEAVSREQPKLVSFFYTNCPDICPTTMIDLQNLQQAMTDNGISKDQYQIVSVTLDPSSDSKERILQYREAFGITNSNWLFLRGSEEEIKSFTREFNFVYKKNEDGFLTHTISMYVVDSKDQIRSRHDMAVGDKEVNIDEIVSHLKQLIIRTE